VSLFRVLHCAISLGAHVVRRVFVHGAAASEPELLPRALRFGVLDDLNVPAFKSNTAAAQAWSTSIGLAVKFLTASTNREIDETFARAVTSGSTR
jgi:hypothetical protein